MSEPHGFVLLHKPPGVTSFASLGAVKRALGTRHVGHTGTLDRFAEGLVVALCGGMTRLAPYLVATEKEYEALFRFGKETETLDPEGAVVRTGPVPDIEGIKAVLPGFIGHIRQVPPLHSAIHVGGQRAYRIARAGGNVELAARDTSIYSIDILAWRPPDLEVRVRCSKGTYIRSLARDLGAAAGSFAYVERLVRTRSGRFSLVDAVTPEAFDPERDLKSWEACLRTIDGIEIATVRAPAVRQVESGAHLDDASLSAAPAGDGLIALFDEQSRFLALTRRESGLYRYEFVGARLR